MRFNLAIERSEAAASGPKRDLVHEIAVGAVVGLLAIVQSIGFGTLLYSGAPASVASIGIGTALLTTTLLALLIPFAGSYRGLIATAQSVPAAAMAVSVSAIAASLAGRPPETLLATVVVTVAATTLVIGAGAWLLGTFRLSRFIRFIPFPVIGGFLAGSGWLVFVGGIDALAGAHFVSTPMALLAEPTMAGRVAAAGAVLTAIWLIQRLTGWKLGLPAVIAAALVLFNLAVWLTGTPQAALRDGQWLLALPDRRTLWPPIAPGDLAAVDWGAIAGQIPSLLTVPVLTFIAALMNATGVELEVRRDFDLDRELRALGIGNLLAGLGGGIPGYANLSFSSLVARLGAAHVTAGITVAAFAAAAIVLGHEILSVIPTPLLGAVLIWIGGGLIRQWLVRSYTRLARAEYAVVVLIFAIIAFVGFAWGILVGLIAAAVLFAIEYGRIDIVRYTLTGREYQTRADTSDERLEALRGHGEAILLFRLQGFLFFGTADRLRKTIQARIAAHTDTPVRFLVIDFHRVSGLDSSAVMSFIRLAQLSGPGNFTIVLSGMSDQVQTAMNRGGLDAAGGTVRVAATFEDGVEWCEDRLLADVAPKLAEARTRPARDMLIDVVGDAEFAEAMMPYFERVEIDKGEALIVQDRPSDDIFFIEEGRAAVELTNGAQTIRLATLTHGAIVGEVAFYLARPRSASVVAESALVAWRFSRASLERLERARPELAARFHAGISAMLADRLTMTNRLVRLLAD